MDFAVVDAAAEQIGPKDTGPVPTAVDGAERGAVDFNALLPQVLAEVLLLREAEVGEGLVDEVLLAPAHKAVADDHRIVVLVLHNGYPFACARRQADGQNITR